MPGRRLKDVARQRHCGREDGVEFLLITLCQCQQRGARRRGDGVKDAEQWFISERVGAPADRSASMVMTNLRAEGWAVLGWVDRDWFSEDVGVDLHQQRIVMR